MSVRDDLVWKALADPVRRRILDLLRKGPHTTGELAARFPRISRVAVMKHLEVLVRARLVLVRRQGRRRWNFPNPVPIQRVCERWVHGHTAVLASGLLALKSHVEGAGLKPKKERTHV
jgi:DNA-binding transcriptional ArsR family regulator